MGCAAPPSLDNLVRFAGNACRSLQLGSASLLLSRSACVPALSEAAPVCQQHNARLHLLSDWRSRRSPCLLLSGSQVRERSQLLFPPLVRNPSRNQALHSGLQWGPLRRESPCYPNTLRFVVAPKKKCAFEMWWDHPHSSSCRHRCSADTS